MAAISVGRLSNMRGRRSDLILNSSGGWKETDEKANKIQDFWEIIGWLFSNINLEALVESWNSGIKYLPKRSWLEGRRWDSSRFGRRNFGEKSTMNGALGDPTEARSIISRDGRVPGTSRWVQRGLATQSPWLQIITPASLAASSRKRSWNLLKQFPLRLLVLWIARR